MYLIRFQSPVQGHQEGGAGGYNDPGAHEGAHWLQEGLKGDQITFRNQHVRPSF